MYFKNKLTQDVTRLSICCIALNVFHVLPHYFKWFFHQNTQTFFLFGGGRGKTQRNASVGNILLFL